MLKRYHNKSVKPRSYAPDNKMWLNGKYIKTKQYQKLEAKFFGLFQVLQPLSKKTYKLDLSTRWKIYNVFYISLLKHDTTKKRQIDDKFANLELELDTGDNKEYKVESIKDSAVDAKKATN